MAPAVGATSVALEPDRGPADGGQKTGRSLRATRQILLIALFYGVYTLIRDLRGTRPVSAATALHNAEDIIHLEQALHLFHEAQIQHFFLRDRTWISFLDDWYGTAHFLVTAAVLVVLFYFFHDRYRRWRNTLAVATGLALIGFAVFPVMPPRLLPASFGFTDTLARIGGLWNFETGPMPHLSDQFAAMPSLHFAWALWSGAAIFALSRRWWTRAIGIGYPAVTLVCVIITANHYFADVAAGVVIVVAGYGAALALERFHHLSPALPAGPATARPDGPAAALTGVPEPEQLPG